MTNANVTGTIAVKGVDGKYMKVTSTNGLEFGNQKLDNNSKFTVKQAGGGQVSLTGMS